MGSGTPGTSSEFSILQVIIPRLSIRWQIQSLNFAQFLHTSIKLYQERLIVFMVKRHYGQKHKFERIALLFPRYAPALIAL